MEQMNDQGRENLVAVEDLLAIIMKKLRENPEIMQKSLNYGRLTWRRKRKNGEFEVDLEPRL